MYHRWIIPTGILCFILFALRYVALLDNNKSRSSVILTYLIRKDEVYNSGDFINLGFSRFQFEQAKLEETQREHDYEITAILLHWKPLEGLQRTLEHLLTTSLFKQIIVWNNNPQINLTRQHLSNNSHVPREFIRIINSEEYLKCVAKYHACIEAKTNACFYADNHWQTARYSKSLIATFRSNPQGLHSLTDPYTYLVSLTRNYFDNIIDLHIGISSCIDCGSVFLREYAQKYLHQLKKVLANRSELSSSIEESPPFARTPNFPKWQYKDSDLGIRKQTHRLPHYVKSPSLTGDFIFYSNVLPFEMHKTSVDISQNWPRTHDVTHFLSHDTLKAVDGQLATCWRTNRDLRSGDFFAIDFLRAQTNITFTLTVSHSPILQQSLNLRISFDGVMWISYRSLKGRFIEKKQTLHGGLQTILIDSSQFALGFESFRYIGFEVIDSSNQRFEVCEIEIISKDDIGNILPEFQTFN